MLQYNEPQKPPVTEYRGMKVQTGVAWVIRQLKHDDMLYAGDIARGEYRGFAAIGDSCDHNMLLPFSNTFTNSDEQIAFYSEVIAGVSEVLINYWEDYQRRLQQLKKPETSSEK